MRRISLLGAILRAFRTPRAHPPPGAHLVELRTLIEAHPDRVVAVFPETTTTNGQGILTLSPSLLSAPPNAKIFPINLRYTPADITTPLPGTYFTFLWNLLSEPTHCIQVRIAECVYNSSRQPTPLTAPGRSYASNLLETLQSDELATSSSTDTLTSADEPRSGSEQSVEERKVLDRVSEALARLGRAKRVALGPRDKIVFVESWKRRHRT